MNSERRFSPRVFTDLEAELVNTQGERDRARLCNLSLGGLSLRGDANLQRLVRQAQTTPGAPFTPVEVEVRVSLPVSGDPVSVALTCRHMHTRRVAHDLFELGFRILASEGQQPETLGEYLKTAAIRRQ
jgi:hypothetical protein